MFNFAAKSLQSRSTESLVEKDTNDIRTPASLNLSEAARHASILGCLEGTVRSLARLLKLRGDAPEDIIEKIRPLIASCVANGDLNKADAEWVFGVDWYATSSDYMPVYSVPSDSLWSFYWEIVESTKSSKVWTSDYRREIEKDVDPQEKAILDAFEKARKEYCDAMRIRDEFFGKRAATVVHDFFRKYGDQISAIDDELASFVQTQISETLSQMTNDNTCPSDPNIENEVHVVHEQIDLDHPND